MGFELLSSTKEEILEILVQTPEANGFQRFMERYATEKNFGRPYPSIQICQLLDELVAENYISPFRAPGGLMLKFSLLPRGQNYFEMKKHSSSSNIYSGSVFNASSGGQIAFENSNMQVNLNESGNASTQFQTRDNDPKSDSIATTSNTKSWGEKYVIPILVAVIGALAVISATIIGR